MELTTQELMIVDHQFSNLEAYIQLVCDEKVTFFHPELFIKSSLDATEKLKSIIEEQKKINKSIFCYQVLQKNTSLYLGMFSFQVVQTLNEYRLGKLEFLLSSFMNTNQMIEAIKSSLEYMILHLYFIKIVSYVLDSDIKSREILEGCGFIVDKQSQVLFDGDTHNLLTYKITKPMYLKK